MPSSGPLSLHTPLPPPRRHRSRITALSRSLPPRSRYLLPCSPPTSFGVSCPPPMRRRKRTSTCRIVTASVTTEDAPSSAGEEDLNGIRGGTDLPTLLRRFWKVAAPYWSSEDKTQARLRLAAVFTLTLATTGISVGFNFLGRDFYNALARSRTIHQAASLLPHWFCCWNSVWRCLCHFQMQFFVLRDYSRETLSLRWRSWMTSFYMKRYFKDQTFYKIQSQSIIDNPDQRIVDDLSSFTGTALGFSLTLFNAAIDLISFSNILYGIYPPLFVVLLVYSIGGTAVSVLLGKGLVNLNFMQEKKEADFRYGLVRIRENAESIAFYGGEGNEMQLLLQRFRSAFENLSELLIASRNLEFFTSGYRYLIQILPAAVVAPMYFSGKIEFGVINQSVSAFNHILSDFSLIVYQFQAISAFSAVIDRLGEFDDVLDGTQSSNVLEPENSLKISFQHYNIKSPLLEANGSISPDEDFKLLEIQNLTLLTPKSARTLILDLSLEINTKDHLLVTGPSGSGKTSLLRALAGLWRSGSGKITFFKRDMGKSQSLASLDMSSSDPSKEPVRDDKIDSFKYRRAEDVFFLPQRPYMVLGTLCEQLLYPTWVEESLGLSQDASSDALPFSLQMSSLQDVRSDLKPTEDELIQVLQDVHLGDIISRFKGLHTIYEWSSVLSLGEQQRLAFARLLLSKPKLILLDESTSALDDANEAHLYRQIEAAGITYVSIGHRRTLYNFHNKVLHISKFDSENGSKTNWHLEPINQSSTYEQSQKSS